MASLPKVDFTNMKKFYQDVEVYYNDYLPLKNMLLELNATLRWELFNTIHKEDVIKGKEDWLFYGETMPDYRGINLLSTAELEEFLEQLKYMEAICEENGTGF